MYSIIIPYRDREQHLSTLLPRLINLFSDKEYEIIVSEQGNDEKFNSAVVQNVGARFAVGDILVFHDVDWYPSDNVSYEFDGTPVYPYDKAIFLNQEGGLRPVWDIPRGYRHFEQDASDHVGGVIIVSREQFETIGGWSPLYIGWGKEDNDRDARIRSKYDLIHREGTFYTLHHEDNCPPTSDRDFIRNHQLFANKESYYHIGTDNVTYDYEEKGFTDPAYDKVRWIRSFNYKVNT